MFEGDYIADCKELRLAIADLKSEALKFGQEIPALQNPIDAEDQIWERNARIFDKIKWIRSSVQEFLLEGVRAEFDHVDGKKMAVIFVKEVETFDITFRVGDKVRVIPAKADYLLKNSNLDKMPDDITIVGFNNRGQGVVLQLDGAKVVDFDVVTFTKAFGLGKIFEIVK